MKLASYLRDDQPRSGVLRLAESGAVEVVDVCDHAPDLPNSVKRLLEAGLEALQRADAATRLANGVDMTHVQLLPPVVDPQKILCVGLNYADHAAETGAQVGDEPVIFNKFPTCLRGVDQAIELPPESAEVDYEAELVVVIGRRARRVPRSTALQYVAGYACGHDVSARDWQKGKPGKQWLLGKSFDSFAPLGPWLATADEIADPHQLDIQLRLNGQVMQSSNTRQLIFGVDYLVSYLSHVCTLLPGDLIYTGTPPGVGMARQPPVFLQPGDIVEVSIPGLGTLRNPVVAGGER
ncbi:MAG TPA: fumarylacetoacetate hydrolase family protein [Lacipirellulaceae bacterium]|nr:fumarylacetoacetate hydrolase family protein [Lacipirellulaceae bacterium]